MISNPVVGNIGSGTSLIQTLIPIAIEWAFIIGAIIFFFMLIFGAIQWISSGGDKQNIATARGKITSAIVGLVILFSVFVIIQLIGVFFKVNLLQLNLPTISGGSNSGPAPQQTCTITCGNPLQYHCQPDQFGGTCVAN